MQTVYKQLFQLNIEHEFFRLGKAIDLSFDPLPGSQVLMKNRDIRIRKLDNALDIYKGEVNTQSDTMPNKDVRISLHFQVLSYDNLWWNYTQMPEHTEGQVVVFQPNKADGSSQELESVAYDVKPTLFAVKIPAKKVVLEVKDEWNNTVWMQEVDGSKQGVATVNLNDETQAVYTLFQDGNVQFNFFCCDKLNPNCVAIVKLELSGNNTVSQLRFESRSLYWKYQIATTSQRKIAITQLKMADTDIYAFNGPIPEKMVNDQEVQAFTSVEPLKMLDSLEEHPVLEVSYLDPTTNKEKVMEVKLPAPHTEHIIRQLSDKGDPMDCCINIVYI